jgi:hypothetical protein
LVRPVPNALDSTASVYLQDGALPDLEAWPKELADVVHGNYRFRGVEITVAGVVKADQGGALVLQGDALRPPLALQAIQPEDKIQWDRATAAPQPLTALEAAAYASLGEKVKSGGNSLQVTVTGPLHKSGPGYVLKVRSFVAH